MGFYGDCTTAILAGGAAYIKTLDAKFSDYQHTWGDMGTLEQFRANLIYFAGYCNQSDRETACNRINAWATARGWKAS